MSVDRASETSRLQATGYSSRAGIELTPDQVNRYVTRRGSPYPPDSQTVDQDLLRTIFTPAQRALFEEHRSHPHVFTPWRAEISDEPTAV